MRSVGQGGWNPLLTVPGVQYPGQVQRKRASRDMTLMGQLRKMAQADLRRVEKARRRLEAAYRDRDEAIALAWFSGETMRDIAKHAGVGVSRVQQIVAAHRQQI